MTKAVQFGDFIKEKRLALGVSLRNFCLENGFDAGNWSKYERGVIAPPQAREKRLRLAQALGIQEGTDEWLEFCDLAAACQGQIPSDLRKDERVMNALPILFRSARKKSVTEDDLRDLVSAVKRELQ